ncbi:MAG: hypothetical protein LIP09_05260 [Bacteroidales bacterium]|nr:hypothetical protein [Bacteroidales bacterium]
MTLRCGAIIERGLALPEARYAMPSYDAETLPEGSVRVIKFHCMGDVEDFYKASLMDADSTQDGNLIYEAIAQLQEHVDASIPNCKIAQLFPHPNRIHPRELYQLANDHQEALKRWATVNF